MKFSVGRKCLVRMFALCFSLACLSIVYVVQKESRRLPRRVRVRPAAAHHHLYPSNWTLIDLRRFEFLLNSDVCGPSSPSSPAVQLLVSVTSHASHASLRQAFRRALPADVLRRFQMRRIFVVARINGRQTDYGAANQTALEEEHLLYGDIVQGDFLESYRNLSYKHVLGLKYAVHYCPQARYVLKMDDDIAVDIFQVLRFMQDSNINGAGGGDEEEEEEDQSLKIAGAVMRGDELNPLRDARSKWCVSYDEYSPSKYPPFCSGWAYAATMASARQLARISEWTPFFWIDDVYVTGLLANLSNIRLVDLRPKLTTFEHDIQCCLQHPDRPCDYFIGPALNAGVLEEFHRHTLRCRLGNCRQETTASRPICLRAGNAAVNHMPKHATGQVIAVMK